VLVKLFPIDIILWKPFTNCDIHCNTNSKHCHVGELHRSKYILKIPDHRSECVNRQSSEVCVYIEVLLTWLHILAPVIYSCLSHNEVHVCKCIFSLLLNFLYCIWKLSDQSVCERERERANRADVCHWWIQTCLIEWFLSLLTVQIQ